MNDESELLDCAVCLDAFEDPRFLHCCHTFCLRCIEPLVGFGGITCPLCRQTTTLARLGGASNLTKNFYVEKTKLALHKNSDHGNWKKESSFLNQNHGNQESRFRNQNRGNHESRFRNQNLGDQMPHRDQPSVDIHQTLRNHRVRSHHNLNFLVNSKKNMALVLFLLLLGLYLLQFEMTQKVLTFCLMAIMDMKVKMYNGDNIALAIVAYTVASFLVVCFTFVLCMCALRFVIKFAYAAIKILLKGVIRGVILYCFAYFVYFVFKLF